MATESSHRLAVILHADVVDSTALVRQDERVAHERIQAAFQAFAEVLGTHGGAAKEIRGDALVAEFPRVANAVVAALHAQRENALRNASHTDGIAPVI